MMRFSSRKAMRGSITVEASLLFPVVVICILPFIYLLRMLMVQTVLEQGLDSCLQSIAAEVYVLKRAEILPEDGEEEESKPEIEAGQREQFDELWDRYASFLEEDWESGLEAAGINLAGQWLLRSRLEEWLETEDPESWGIVNGWQGISVGESRFFYGEEGHHSLIKGALTFRWNLRFAFWQPEEVTVQRVYHSFVGEPGAGSLAEKPEDSDEVMVYRIGQGMRYHNLSCYLIQKNVYTCSRPEAEQEGLKPCSRCHPSGSQTVCCTVGGEHYHSKQCTYLYPNLQAISLEKTKELGLSPCGLCQGGGGYFS